MQAFVTPQNIDYVDVHNTDVKVITYNTNSKEINCIKALPVVYPPTFEDDTWFLPEGKWYVIAPK